MPKRKSIVPDSFRLGGVLWTVKRVPAEEMDGNAGRCDWGTATLWLTEGQPQEVEEWTHCHELGHAILFAQGVPIEQHDEQQIDRWATFLHQYLTTAKRGR